MINQLNFGLPETSQYITSRRLAKFYPAGSDIYPNQGGNNNIRFNISTDDNNFVDLSSIRIFATLETMTLKENTFYALYLDYTVSFNGIC